jgi:hypothetical protein
MTQLVPATINQHDTQPEELKIEKIAGEPVISMERALRVLYNIQRTFPEWGPLNLPYASEVEATSLQARSHYVQFIKRCLGIHATYGHSIQTNQIWDR